MVVLGSNEEEGSDVAGITGESHGVAGEAEGATSGIGSVGAAWVGGVMSTGISTCYGSFGCSRCGISGCSGSIGAPGSAP